MATETVGQRVRRLRDVFGWTQKELATRVGTDSNTVSRWESGVGISQAYLVGLAREFRCSVDDLVGSTTEPADVRLALQILAEIRAKVDDLEGRLRPLESTPQPPEHEGAKRAVQQTIRNRKAQRRKEAS